MRAVLMSEAGPAERLRVEEIDPPVLPDQESLLVRLKAAGVNPVDAKLRSRGTFFPERMPAILGCDGAGVVEAVGSGVSRFQPGDQVFFCNGGIGDQPGNYAEYTTVHQDYAAAKPARVSFAEAAAAPLVLLTAWESLHDRGRITAGQRVLIHAGAGGVGHVAIQLARLAGAEVAATVSSDHKAQIVKDLGAERAILYSEEDWIEAALDWSGGHGAEVTLDTVGGRVFEDSFQATAHYGDLVTLLQPGADVKWQGARVRNLRLALELMLTPMLEGMDGARRHQAGILTKCARLMDDGQLRVKVSHIYPLEQAVEAHRAIEQGHTEGKLVLSLE